MIRNQHPKARRWGRAIAPTRRVPRAPPLDRTTARSPQHCPAPHPRAQLLEEGQQVHVAFTGEFGPHTVTARQLTSEVRGGGVVGGGTRGAWRRAKECGCHERWVLLPYTAAAGSSAAPEAERACAPTAASNAAPAPSPPSRARSRLQREAQ